MNGRFSAGSVAAISLAVLLLTAGVVRADFLISPYGSRSPDYLRDNGSLVRNYSPESHEAESLDAFTLSADGNSVYVFGNNLGYISTFAFDLATGASQGDLGPNYPPFGSTWPVGIVENFAVDRPQTRSGVPTYAGDLFYIGIANPISGPFYNVLNIVDTVAGEFVGQVPLPGTPTIHDYAFGAGALGPQSRLLVATEAGVFAFQEVATLGGTTFELESATPLIAASMGELEIGPDGRIYAPFGGGISRFEAADGSFIDTFLTPAQYNPQSLQSVVMRFGPEGDLYFGSSSFPATSTMIKFDGTTGASQNFPALTNLEISDFVVLSVPEPSALLLATIGAALVGLRRRQFGARR